MGRLVATLAACATLLFAGAAHAQTRTIEIGGGEAERNLIDPAWLSVQTPWRQTDDLREQARSEMWNAIVVVDETGAVAEVMLGDGPETQRDEARALLMGQRYRPFQQDGQAVRARFMTGVMAAPADYNGPADRAFPAAGDHSDLRIRLIRAGCYGTCPAYDLEINGDGEVRYVGHAHVAQMGEHSWTIPRERVAEIVEVFRRADYFDLQGYYAIPVFHFATQISSIRIDGREKFVFNYGASAQLNASVIPANSDFRFEMLAPAAVVDVEDAIDRLAGVARYVGSPEAARE